MLATDSAGNSPFSNVATATTQAAQPPTAPTNLTATAISGSQINLSWTASTANVADHRLHGLPREPRQLDLRAGRHDQRQPPPTATLG